MDDDENNLPVTLVWGYCDDGALPSDELCVPCGGDTHAPTPAPTPMPAPTHAPTPAPTPAPSYTGAAPRPSPAPTTPTPKPMPQLRVDAHARANHASAALDWWAWLLIGASIVLALGGGAAAAVLLWRRRQRAGREVDMDFGLNTEPVIQAGYMGLSEDLYL